MNDIKLTIKNLLPKSWTDIAFSVKSVFVRLPEAKAYIDHVRGKKGIEIGGPSTIFKTILPLYRHVGSLDCVNFSNKTIWEGNLAKGRHFEYYLNRRGWQYVLDGTDLSQIESGTYDFLLSSNCLEHIANPVKALHEWKRILKPGGILVLILPNKISNFDHNRPTTTFEHIVADFNGNVDEHDLFHLDEILALHDLSMDPPAGTPENFKKRSLDNFHNRTLHHHVFDLSLIDSMLDYAGFSVIQTNETKHDFFTLASRND